MNYIRQNNLLIIEAENTDGQFEPIVQIRTPQNHSERYIKYSVYTYAKGKIIEDTFYFDNYSDMENYELRRIRTKNEILQNCYNASFVVMADHYLFLDVIIEDGFLNLPEYATVPSNKEIVTKVRE